MSNVIEGVSIPDCYIIRLSYPEEMAGTEIRTIEMDFLTVKKQREIKKSYKSRDEKTYEINTHEYMSDNEKIEQLKKLDEMLYDPLEVALFKTLVREKFQKEMEGYISYNLDEIIDACKNQVKGNVVQYYKYLGLDEVAIEKIITKQCVKLISPLPEIKEVRIRMPLTKEVMQFKQNITAYQYNDIDDAYYANDMLMVSCTNLEKEDIIKMAYFDYKAVLAGLTFFLPREFNAKKKSIQ